MNTRPHLRIPDCIVIEGAGADVLRWSVAPRSVDMVYIDPPFFTQMDWKGTAGSFSDRWSWDEVAESRLAALQMTNRVHADVLRVIAGTRRALLAYLLAMRELIAACRRSLTVAGSLWLHCDDTASSYLAIMCDLVFGPTRAWGSFIWKRSNGHNIGGGRHFARCHDTILVYLRSGAALARLGRSGTGAHVSRRIEIDGIRGPLLCGFAEDQLAAAAKERVGYPTQKPVNLLRRFIATGSYPGDLILDPCCGSGTTLVAARELGRRAIGIDANPDAVALARRRTGVSFQMELL